MAIQFMNMPAAKYPDNAQLDLASLARPLFTGLAQYSKGVNDAAIADQDRQIGQAAATQGYGAAGRQALALGRLDEGAKLAQLGQGQQDALRKRYGALAQRVDYEQDPAKRSAMWQGALERMKREGAQYGITSDFDPEELDPVNGPKMFMSMAGIGSDPLEREMKQAELGKTRAETTALAQKGAFNNSIMEMIRGGDPAMPPEAPPTGSIPQAIPQSAPGGPAVMQPQQARFTPAPGNPNPGPQSQDLPPPGAPSAGPAPAASLTDLYQTVQNGPPQGNGGATVQLAADGGAPAPGQPGPAPQPQAQGADMVDTPMGRMPRARARQLGGAMLMSPEYAPMGKEMIDASRGVAPDLAKPAVNTLQEKQFNTAEQYARLKSIEQSWRPEYQQIENRVGFKWNELLDSFGATRKALSPQQRQELSAYSANRAEALNNMNQYIKEQTGATVGVQEAQRLLPAMPNPGSGLFDGDSPTVFNAKMQNTIRLMKMANARYNYYTRNGFQGSLEDLAKQVPLERMSSVIQERSEAIAQEAMSANPGFTIEDIKPIVRQRLRVEFGVDA